MKVSVTNCVVDRDATTKTPKQVWAWELPVLESQFPGGAVRIIDTEFVEKEELPDAEEEYVRLERAYGGEQEPGGSHVSMAYDRGHKGVKLLRQAIEDAVDGATKKSKAQRKAEYEAADKAEAAALKAEAKADADLAKADAAAAAAKAASVKVHSGTPKDPLS